jgi:hypothetical protein
VITACRPGHAGVLRKDEARTKYAELKYQTCDAQSRMLITRQERPREESERSMVSTPRPIVGDMRILIVGAAGTFGRAIHQRFQERGHDIVTVGRTTGDIRCDIAQCHELEAVQTVCRYKEMHLHSVE